jgi:hypothetical protein
MVNESQMSDAQKRVIMGQKSPVELGPFERLAEAISSFNRQMGDVLNTVEEKVDGLVGPIPHDDPPPDDCADGLCAKMHADVNIALSRLHKFESEIQRL